MKVILLKDAAGVGQIGTIRDVSDGYALNFLIPRGFAKQATKEAVEKHEKQQSQNSAQSAKENEALALALKAIEGTKVVMRVKANDQGHLFKKLSTKDLAAKISEIAKAKIAPEMIQAPEALKDVGEFPLTVSGGGVSIALNLSVEKA